MYEPVNGKSIGQNNKTDLKVLRNSNAVCISAILYDDEPNKIYRELTNRDDYGVAALFSVFTNGNNHRQQDF